MSLKQVQLPQWRHSHPSDLIECAQHNSLNSESMNISLVNTLAQVILSLPQEEQHLPQQQLAPQPRKSRTRRRVPIIETGDSFDFCVAETVAEAAQQEGWLDSNHTNHQQLPQVQLQYQPVASGSRQVEERSQKSLSILQEFLRL